MAADALPCPHLSNSLAPYSISDQLNDFVYTYLFFLGSTGYAILSFTGVSIIIQSQDLGWLTAIGQNSSYPLYVLFILSTWAVIGERLTGSVRELDCVLVVGPH